MEIRLSIVITVVSGADALRHCLDAISDQADSRTEVIVPYDTRSIEIESMKQEYPGVIFLFDQESDRVAIEKLREHDLYDRRRARGLSIARGSIIALTEDHAVPAQDWVRKIMAAHERSPAVIGGAIDNRVDRPLNWALYYCDFGRYGTPMRSGQAEYASDVNLSYKRQALMAVSDAWHSGYHETTVNWALQARGEELHLDPEILVYQQRPGIGFGRAYRERMEWGAVFGETRAATISLPHRLAYAFGAVALPFLLTGRAVRHMRRQGRTLTEMLIIIPMVFILMTGWSLGEMIGYITGGKSIREAERPAEQQPESSFEVDHR